MSAYQRTLDHLEGLTSLGIRPGLESIEAAVGRLGHPEACAPLVRVGGTNGKGSTASLVASALSLAGHRTGLFTSPHLIDVRERIRIDGKIISRSAFSRAIAEVRRALDDSLELTYFEMIAAAALVAFRQARVDVIVLEVGLGGRWDATNVGEAAVAVITNVEMDHMQHLGRSRAAIAGEKVRIATPGGVLVTGVSPGPAREVIRRYARKHRIRLRQPPVVPLRGRSFRYRGPVFDVEVAEPGLTGAFQLRNAALATATLEELHGKGLAVPPEVLVRALEHARWPGRLHRLPGRPGLLVDGAHNPHAARALVASLDRALPERPRVLLVAQLARKSPLGFLRAFRGAVDRVVTTTLEDHACIDARRLAEIATSLGLKAEARPTLDAALERARRIAGARGGVCATGSLYMVGQLLQPKDVAFLSVDIAPPPTESKDARRP